MPQLTAAWLSFALSMAAMAEPAAQKDLVRITEHKRGERGQSAHRNI